MVNCMCDGSTGWKVASNTSGNMGLVVIKHKNSSVFTRLHFI